MRNAFARPARRGLDDAEALQVASGASPEQVQALLEQVVEAARALRFAVHDHFVVGGQAVTSFRTLGLL